MKQLLVISCFISLVLTTPLQAETTEEWAQRALRIQNSIDNDVALTKTTWIGTHNSYANAHDDNFSDLNQAYSVREQLELGVRELVYDVHYSYSDVRVCHNGSDIGGCIDGITGNRKLKDALDDIVEWIEDGNNDQVVLLKLELQNSAQNNINKIEKKIENHILNYTYTPEQASPLGSYYSCTELNTSQLSKKNVLNAGKNVILLTTEDCQKDNGFNKMVFYGGDFIEDVNSVEKLESWSASEKANRMSRVKDSVTKQRILSTATSAKLRPNTIQDYLDEGLNILEFYGFNASGSEWKVNGEYPVALEDVVWSWDEGEPNDWHGEDCGMINSQGRFNDADCGNSYSFVCYDDSQGWTVTAVSSVWTYGDMACADTGSSFKAPVNKVELNALNEVLGGNSAWINYSDADTEGEWLVNQ